MNYKIIIWNVPWEVELSENEFKRFEELNWEAEKKNFVEIAKFAGFYISEGQSIK